MRKFFAHALNRKLSASGLLAKPSKAPELCPAYCVTETTKNYIGELQTLIAAICPGSIASVR
jgi:hypothetical protein